MKRKISLFDLSFDQEYDRWLQRRFFMIHTGIIPEDSDLFEGVNDWLQHRYIPWVLQPICYKKGKRNE